MAREGEGPHVKICGVTTVDDALMCVELGASAIGLNFVRESPRRITAERARQISRAVGDRALVVGVIAGLDVDDARTLVSDAGLGCLQLHGDETPETLAGLLPHAYKALRVASIADVARAADYAGEYLLVDAKVDGALGGTGHTFDWSLVTDLAAARKLTLAGGLTKPSSVFVAGGRVFWVTAEAAGTVQSAAVGGGALTVYATAQAKPTSVAADATHVYWVNQTGGSVMRVSLVGGTPETVIPGQSQPISIAVDDTSVYWTNYVGGTVMRWAK